MTDVELSPPRIVCAAVRLPHGLVVPSARHFDLTMRLVIASIGIETLQGAEQGFIDQHGAFYNRDEAWVVAHRNGQIVRDESRCIGTLYSENLY